VPGHHSRVAKHPKISEIIEIIVLLFELYKLKHIIFILKPIICCFSKNQSPSYYTLLFGYYTHYTYYIFFCQLQTAHACYFCPQFFQMKIRAHQITMMSKIKSLILIMLIMTINFMFIFFGV